MAPEAASATGSGAPDSGTNVQVAGVDESDVVKTSGNVMVSVINGEVRITRLDGADTKKLADWRPTGGSAQSVLLDRNLAVVIGDSGGIPLGASKLRAPDGIYEAVTELTVLDLTDPAAPRPLRRLELSGTRAGDVRLVDGELRLALNSGPSGIAWKQPVYPKSPNQDPKKAQAEFRKLEKDTLKANKKLIAESTIDNWIPQATVTDLNADGTAQAGPVTRSLIDCPKVAIPGSFSGLSTLSLISADLRTETPLSGWRSAGVIADAARCTPPPSTSGWPRPGGTLCLRPRPSTPSPASSRRSLPTPRSTGSTPGSVRTRNILPPARLPVRC